MPSSAGKPNCTPTPWKITEDARGEIIRAADSNGRPIASIWMNGDDMKGNAALIVKAVNSHDALVTALEELQSAETTYRMTYDLDGYYHQNTLKARDALRSAGYRARAALALTATPAERTGE